MSEDFTKCDNCNSDYFMPWKGYCVLCKMEKSLDDNITIDSKPQCKECILSISEKRPRTCKHEIDI